MTCRVPFSYAAKRGMLLGDSAYGFCLWDMAAYLLVLTLSFGIITSRQKAKLRKTGTALAGMDKHHHQEKLISVAGSSSPHVLGSQGAAHTLAQGWCRAGLTPCRSLSLSINYRGSPRKSNSWLNLVIVNPLPTSECVSYQAQLAAGND